jgi:hypothetical protein
VDHVGHFVVQQAHQRTCGLLALVALDAFHGLLISFRGAPFERRQENRVTQIPKIGFGPISAQRVAFLRLGV